MSNDLCMRCYISGRVQGVSYRASAQKMAKQLMITGWAKNLLDGRVEVFACGKEDKLDEFYIWLQQGHLMQGLMFVHARIYLGKIISLLMSYKKSLL